MHAKKRTQWITLFDIASQMSTSQAYWMTLALISNIANYLNYNYFWVSDGIDNVMLWLWKFSDFCSRHTIGVAGDDIMLHILVFLCDDAGRYTLLSLQSSRVKRVMDSTLANECLAAVEVSDASIALSSLLSSMLGCPRFPLSVLCDNKSLVDNVHSSTAVDNKRLQNDISSLRDDLNQKNIHELRWIETSLQV